MKAGEIVYDKLKSTTAVTAIVGQRIYPVDVPLEVDLPCCWYEVNTGESVDGSAPVSNVQVQVGCLAQSESAADGLAVVVDAALNGLTASKSGTWLRSLTRAGRTPSRDAENNLWGVALVYNAIVMY